MLVGHLAHEVGEFEAGAGEMPLEFDDGSIVPKRFHEEFNKATA